MRTDDTVPAGEVDASELKIAVITARFNGAITEGLRLGATAWLSEAGASVTEVESPGAFELPLLAQRCAANGFDGVVCLGAVIEGDTDHYEHVAHRASEGLMRVQLDSGIPVAFGILTVRNVEDATARSQPDEHNKGREAAIAAVSAALALRTLG